MREKVGSAPVAESAPPVAGFYSPDLLKPRVIAPEVSISPIITASLTCPRCRRTAWIRDGEGLNRCINCGMPQKYAICECGNGLAAHGPRGCEGVGADGNPCECQRRRAS